MSDGSGSGLGYLLILGLPFLLLAWMFFTQRQRSKQAQSLQESLQVGEEVVTTSGLYGTITALDERVVTLDTGDGTHLRFDRRAVGMRAPEVG
ncbi:preprotein translocase subunit YajC [Phycicoccus sp. CSK15P-2]|uniref:preprotein translocase subunit YajC n=1 Tax=Phycicoccus sp. CSK15P-2 TaxID=2807627 RepID=UPI00194FB943|nr:preprotein translocase subunit YajC [Phycicoccus sp. CSK15P-2]MBM6403909.1 preprotein translocase subunit YajC [Phycicoccus sp. CSK15P-2]